jgi:Na+/H+-dicarboxylate symporter
VKSFDYRIQNQRIENRVKYEKWALATPDVNVKGECISCNSTDNKLNPVTEEIDSKVAEKIKLASQTKQQGPLQFIVEIVPDNIFAALTSGKAMLQVIFFALFFGVALVSLPQEIASSLTPVINATNEVFLKMVDIIMKASPFFVFALLAGEMAKIAGNDISKINETFKGLSWYSLTVVAGLAFMIFVFYPFLVKFVTKKIGYTQFFRAIAPAQLLAFSSSSSAATLPVTLECVEDNLKVSKEISGFVLPVGATVNMDGTSLYQAVAVVFLAQMHMVDLTLLEQISIVFTATMASIGAAAVPGAGLIMLIIVLQSVGLNPVWISIILPVDRILDMCRTVVNVTGDATVATIIAKSEGELR